MIFIIAYIILFIVLVITLQMVLPFFKMVFYRYKYGKGVSYYYYPFFGRVIENRMATKKYNDMLYLRKTQRTEHPEIDIELTNHYSGKLIFQISRHEHIKFIVTNQKLYVKPQLEFGNIYIQKGILFNDKEWSDQRNFLSKFFTFQVVDQSFDTVRTETQKAFKGKEGQFNVHQICSRIAGEVVTKTVFGNNMESVTFDGISFSQHMAITVAKILGYAKGSQTYCMLRKMFTKNPPKFLQTKLEIKTLEQLESVKQVIREIIKTRSQNLGNDFLSQYIKETQNNPNITEETIIHQYISLLFAGMDTTSTLASTICVLLAQNPSVQQRLREEILNKRKSYEELTAKSVNSEYPLLEATIKESLRMYTPATGLLARVSNEGHFLGKYYIPKGQYVQVGYAQNYYDPNYFEDPFTFNIDRWLDGKNSDKEISIFTPFSSGNRNCLGQHLSKQEIRLMLIYILMNYELELINKNVIWQLEFTYTVKDKNCVLFKKIQY